MIVCNIVNIRINYCLVYNLLFELHELMNKKKLFSNVRSMQHGGWPSAGYGWPTQAPKDGLKEKSKPTNSTPCYLSVA